MSSADAIAGNEPCIIQAFATNPTESKFRWGFMLYCMEVAMGFKEIYRLTVGKGAIVPLPGLVEPELKRRQTEASETIQKSTVQSYACNHVYHDDVRNVLNEIRALQAAHVAGLGDVARERDRLRDELGRQKTIMEKAAAAALKETKNQLDAQKRDNDARNAASGRELESTKAQLAAATQELVALKANQQLGEKVDAIQAALATTLQKLSDAEVGMIDHIKTAAPPDVSALIQDYLRRKTTWAEARHGVGDAELAALRATAAEVDRLRKKNADQGREITRLKTSAPDNSKITDFLMNAVVASIQTIEQSAVPLNAAQIQGFRESIENGQLDGLPDRAQNVLKSLAHNAVDIAIVTKTNTDFKRQISTADPSSWQPPVNSPDLVKATAIKPLYHLIVPGNTGFKSVDQLKKFLNTLTDASQFQRSQVWRVSEDHVQSYEGNRYTCLHLASTGEPVRPAPLLCEDMATYLLQNYLMLASNVRMFHMCFHACIAKKNKDESLRLMDFFNMIALSIVPLSKDHVVTKRAQDCAQLLMRIDLRYPTPFLLLLQGYCIGGQFPDYIKLALLDDNLRALRPPLTTDDIRELMDRLLINHGHGLGPKQADFQRLLDFAATVPAAPRGT